MVLADRPTLAEVPLADLSFGVLPYSTTRLRVVSRRHCRPSAGNDKPCFQGFPKSRGDTRPATYNRGPFDIATLAIFPEYLEFEGQEVLQLVVEGVAGRTAT
jgi:hypothetical protein